MTVQKQAEKQSKSEFAKCKQKAMESTAASFGKGKTHPINPSFAPQETFNIKSTNRTAPNSKTILIALSICGVQSIILSDMNWFSYQMQLKNVMCLQCFFRYL